jgi:transcriptional regulator, propionate catabolism operon regulatory protein
MIKILVVVPYEELYEQVRAYLRTLDTRDFIVELEHFIGSEDQVIKHCDADIVVARGITGKSLARQNPAIHLIEISISGSDLISALWHCNHTVKQYRVGVVLTDTSICDPAQLLDLTGMEIHLRHAESEKELYAAIGELSASGIETFIGGLTLCRRCDDLGYQYIHIKSGSEAIARALNEAVAAARSLSRERTRTKLVSTVLNNAEDVMFALNKDGAIIAANTQTALLLLGSRDSPLEGRMLAELLSADEEQAIRDAPPESEVIMRLHDQLVLVKKAPITVGSESLGMLVTCRNIEALREAEQKIRKELSKKGLVAHYNFSDIIHASEAMKTIIANACRYSQVDSTVFIVGETGTGKELFAQSIHNASRRSAQPFVAVNCAALPEQLLESELFGYTDGAFSGAAKGGRMGLFELAHKGTIFLDEIGEMPLSLQAKILRVLQEREIRKIGGDAVVPVDVRIISATNIDILQRVRDGSFREDLYYRINLLNLRIPPLRKRPEDIPLLFRHFVAKFSRETGKPPPRIAGEVESVLAGRFWSGNIRELRNFCERLVILNAGTTINLSDVEPQSSDEAMAAPVHGKVSVGPGMVAGLKGSRSAAAGTGLLSTALYASGMDLKDFADSLGMSRTTLWRKLKAEREASRAASS